MQNAIDADIEIILYLKNDKHLKFYSNGKSI